MVAGGFDDHFYIVITFTELTRRISKRYDDVEVIVKATSNDGLSVTRTADKDSAKTFVQETLKDTWESADEWFVR
ncbi:DinI family protein [Escherichia coli]|nr:DinI family protein [Escherichia coli]